MHSTCGLSADERHERQANRGNGDRENDAQVILCVSDAVKNFVAGPYGSVPVSGKDENNLLSKRYKHSQAADVTDSSPA